MNDHALAATVPPTSNPAAPARKVLRDERAAAEALVRRLTLAVCLLSSLAVTGVASASAEPAGTWFLLEIAGSRPACMDVQPAARCIGTNPRVSRFEIRDGERLEMPHSAPIPPAWAELNRLWVYAPAATGGVLNRTIELAATPMGARLIIRDQDRQYLQSVPLDQWVALGDGQAPPLWVRVTVSLP